MKTSVVQSINRSVDTLSIGDTFYSLQDFASVGGEVSAGDRFTLSEKRQPNSQGVTPITARRIGDDKLFMFSSKSIPHLSFYSSSTSDQLMLDQIGEEDPWEGKKRFIEHEPLAGETLVLHEEAESLFPAEYAQFGAVANLSKHAYPVLNLSIYNKPFIFVDNHPLPIEKISNEFRKLFYIV